MSRPLHRVLRFGALVTLAALGFSAPAAAKRPCESTDELARHGEAIAAKNRARLTKYVRKLGYRPTTLARPAGLGGQPVLAGTSSVSIDGAQVAVFATPATTLGAGQSLSEPLFVRDAAGELFVVEWTPKKRRRVRPRACNCVINGGGAPRRAQLVYQLPAGTTRAKTLAVSKPRLVSFEPIGPVCMIPSAPRP